MRLRSTLHSVRGAGDPEGVDSAGASTVIAPLLAIEREDTTGILEFCAERVSTRIYAHAGEIVFVDGGTLCETLGRMLLRCARLADEHVAAILRRMIVELTEGRRTRFGAVAVEYGLLTSDELTIALSQQMKEKLMGCVHRGQGEWRFTPGEHPVDRNDCHIVRTRPMLVEAAMRFSDRRLGTALALHDKRYPKLVAPEDVISAEFELTSAEAEILPTLDGTSSVHAILSNTKEQVADAKPLLAALVLGGGVELRAAPSEPHPLPVPHDFRTIRRARLSPQYVIAASQHDLAHGSLDGGASPYDTSEAPSEGTIAAALPTSEHFSRKGLARPSPDDRARTSAGFQRLKAELDRRKPDRRHRSSDSKGDIERILLAESAFHQGRLFLRSEEAERALPGLSRAFELRPEQREYELYVKWAQMLVNDRFKDDALREEIRAFAIQLVRESLDCELAYSILGHCAMHEGKDDFARSFFEHATRLDPRLVDASRLAQLLTSRTADPWNKVTSRKERRGDPSGDSDLYDLLPPPPRRASVPDDDSGQRPDATNATVAESTSAAIGTGASAHRRPEDIARAPLPASRGVDGDPSSPAGATRASDGNESLVIDIPVNLQTPPDTFTTSNTQPAPGARTDGDPKTSRSSRRSVALVFAWVASLGVVSAISYVAGKRTVYVPSAVDAGSEATPHVDLTSTSEPPIEIDDSPDLADAPPPASVAAPSRKSASTTGTLKTPRATGRRVYVDGRLVGPGGRDHSVPCGERRVRIGSAGAERTVSIPCGGVVSVP